MLVAGGIWQSPNLDPTTSASPPALLPPHPPTGSALTQHYIIRYLHLIYHYYLPPQLSGTLWMMLMLTPFFLPTPGHIAASVSTYIPSIYSLLMFYYVFHALSPPHHEFFHLQHDESSW
jgi:hypothetical protein